MKNKDIFWHMFEHSGSVDAYLAYKGAGELPEPEMEAGHFRNRRPANGGFENSESF